MARNKTYNTSSRRALKPSRKLSFKYKVVILIFILLLILCGFYFHTRDKDNAATPVTDGQKTTTVTTSTANEKKQLIESGGNKPSTPTSSDGQTASSSIITSLSASQETNGTVTVFTKLDSSTVGRCNLSVSNGDKTTTQNAAIIFQPEFSTCAGFSLPISPLGSGAWTISLTAGSASKTITVEVK